jgi:tRNA threonylcarbamoyladenosine biosynthesis protein TsaE
VTGTTTHSEAETIALGRDLGRRLAGGDVILLAGPLGAGKTAFARGLAEGLGCDTTAVASPTFTIVHEYPGPVPLQHADLYRLTAEEVDDLGLEDLMEGHVLAVEWPDRWRHAPSGAILVSIEPAGGDRRHVRITGHSTR